MKSSVLKCPFFRMGGDDADCLLQADAKAPRPSIKVDNIMANDRSVKTGDSVEINYVGKLQDDTVFDSTEGRESFAFEAGGADVIQGVSEGVIGMKVGEKKTLTLTTDEAYGDHNPELVMQIDIGQMPEDTAEGDVLGDNQDPERKWVVREVGTETVTLDGNHPLAGQTLVFEVELVLIG